jgi:hypothetical protein
MNSKIQLENDKRLAIALGNSLKSENKNIVRNNKRELRAKAAEARAKCFKQGGKKKR